MTDTIFALLLYIAACWAASIENVTEPNVAKREVLEFYPNWVPFANKHGDELGEFIDVTPKAKVKKRLALPANFLLKAIAEPEGDDYYEKGQGESDSEDYYEKKDWSDLNRPEVPVDGSKPAKINDLSDIDGVIHIITQERPSLAQAIEESRHQKQREEENSEIKPEDNTEKPEPNKTAIKKEVSEPKKDKKYEDYIDYEESPQSAERQKPETDEEQAVNEAKKKIILDSVDDLKERHAQEQRVISEKVKQEEFDQEAFERDQVRIRKEHDKYAERHSGRRSKVTPPDYDEYDEKGSWKEKYILKSGKTTTPEPKRSAKTITVPGRMSVFRNPDFYIINDDNEVSETSTEPYKTTASPRRFSSKYILTTTERNLGRDSPEQIRIVPKDIKEGEPVLFFPKLKNKRKLKKLRRTSTVAPDSTVAETIDDRTSTKISTKENDVTETTGADSTEDYKTTALGNDDYKTTAEEKPTALGDETTGGDSDYKTTASGNEVTGPSGDAESTNSDAVSDAVPASSDQKKEEPKDYHVEKALGATALLQLPENVQGGGHEHHSSHEEEHEEHGKKAYEGLHKNSKTKKGHHDKEDHLGKYEDNSGYNKDHHDEKKHYGAHHHEEHGKKHAKYEESGKHSKGHSTKGSHDIHKKEEYEKKVEFFEEEGDSQEEEKHGGHHQEREHAAVGRFKKGDSEAKKEERKKGESGHFNKGGHHVVHRGHKASSGQDGHGMRGKAKHAAEGHQAGKKWIYHHGFPAKTANLVAIDRRDKFAHGPSYYG